MKKAEPASHLGLQARPELLEVIANIADLKDIREEIIFSVMEKVLTKMAVNKYGERYNIRARIHRNNGAIIIERVTEVVNSLESPEENENSEDAVNPNHVILLEEAKKLSPDYKVGDEIVEELPPIEFNRNMVQQALNIINRNIKEFEKQREFELYKDKVGELVSGTVRRNELGNAIIDLGGGAEGFLKRDQIIPGEKLSIGERMRALIVEVKEDVKGPQIMLSRYHPNFVVKLFQQEVPEIFDGVVSIKAIARDAGSRTKMVVESNDAAVDPVGVCVGFKGSRINGILQEMKGEKIDLIKASDRLLDLVIAAFKPTAEILKVVVDEENETLEIVIPSHQLSAAIGRGGQNIKLISRLLKWNIDIMTEDEEKEKRQKDTQAKIANLMDILDVDEVIAHLLVLEGLHGLDTLLETDTAAIAKIEGFNPELAAEIKTRAEAYSKKQQQELNAEIKKLKIASDLINFAAIDLKLKLVLAKKGIKLLSDLADMSSFELAEILEDEQIKIPQHKIENIIMSARRELNY